MMETTMKTFREVYESELNLPRSTVQGWVTTFLKGRGYSDRSEWMFDEKEVEQLWRIRFWKQLGYKNDTIRHLLDKGATCEKKTLSNTIEELERQRAELDNVIRVANLMQETGMTPNGLRFDIIYPMELPYDMVLEFMANSLDEQFYIGDEEMDKLLPEYIVDEIFNCIEIILELYNANVSYKDDRVQELVRTIHYKCEPLVSKSVMMFYLGIKYTLKNKEIASDLKAACGVEKYKYIKQSLYWYCAKNKNNEYDVMGIDSFDRIQELALKRYSANSPDVQSEINNLYNWYSGIKYINEKGRYEMLKRLSQIFAGEKCYKEIDGGKPRGLAWFYSRALQIYCDNVKSVVNLAN